MSAGVQARYKKMMDFFLFFLCRGHSSLVSPSLGVGAFGCMY